MSTFDPDMFMNTQIVGANDTHYIPIPVDEYPGVITKVTPKLAGDKPILEVVWEVDDASVRELTGLEHPTARQTVWLDLNETGGLDQGKGKNVPLGKLREALDQNDPNRPWQPGMLIGQSGLISIGHRPAQTPGDVYAEVKAVAAL